MPLSEVYEKAASPLEKSFGDPYEGLESAAREGVEVLLEQGIPKDLAEVLTEIAKERIRISKVKVKRTINMRCTKPRGVLKIKEALMKAKGINVPHGVGVRIYTVSPPRYRIEVTAHDYKEANTILEKVAETALRIIVKAGGRGTLEGD
jgi:translation initiation factor 2 subunit 1